MSSPRFLRRKTPTEFNVALERVIINPEPPKGKKSAQNKAFEERHAEVFRQYTEKMKNNLKASSKILLEGLKSVSSNLYELDRPFKRYYDNNEILKPYQEITQALRGDFEFYGTPSNKSTRTPRIAPSRPEEPTIEPSSAIKKVILTRLDTEPTPRDKTPTKIVQPPRKSEPKFEIPRLNLSPVKKFDVAPSSCTFRTKAKEPEFIKLDDLNMPTNLYVASMKRRGLIREMIKTKGQMTKEQIEERLERENEVDQIYKNGMNELKKKEIQFRKKDIMSKSPNYNAYYQLLALPTPRRMKVLEKLNTSKGDKEDKAINKNVHRATKLYPDLATLEKGNEYIT